MQVNYYTVYNGDHMDTLVVHLRARRYIQGFAFYRAGTPPPENKKNEVSCSM